MNQNKPDSALATPEVASNLTDASRSVRRGTSESADSRAPESGSASPSIPRWKLIAKRAIDLVGAGILLAVLSPLLAAIALIVKLDSPGSVIYKHERLGLRGRRFRCYKYRSMSDDAERVLRSDPALYDVYVRNHYKAPPGMDGFVTRTGRLLRRSSLDELPQLVNVLRGEMSLVGPRPIVPEELTEYHDADLLLAMRPGMTGAWAVNGRNRVGYPERARVEQDYVREWSLWRDVLLLVRTIPAVFRFDETR